MIRRISYNHGNPNNPTNPGQDLKVIPIAIGTVGINPSEKITNVLKVTMAVGITSSHSEQSS